MSDAGINSETVKAFLVQVISENEQPKFMGVMRARG